MRELFKFFFDNLKEVGFFKYDSLMLCRITHDYFLHVIDFQLDRKIKNLFNVNFAIRLLYIPRPEQGREIIPLQPGSRLDYFLGKRHWWNTTSAEDRHEVLRIIKDSLLPWFEKYSSIDPFIQLQSIERIQNVSPDWRELELFFMLLYKGNHEQARHYARSLLKRPTNRLPYQFLKEHFDYINSPEFNQVDFYNFSLEGNLKALKLPPLV